MSMLDRYEEEFFPTEADLEDYLQEFDALYPCWFDPEMEEQESQKESAGTDTTDASIPF